MKKRRLHNPSKREIRFAQLFLKAIKADYMDSYLVAAVVGWVRQESGGLGSVIGNNPFNLRPGSDVSAYASGRRHSGRWIPGVTKKGGNYTTPGHWSNGWFLTFANLGKAALATAARLTKAGNDYRHYGRIVRALRSKLDGTKDQYANRAIGFLNAIALSKWNVSHYGYDGKDSNTNHLVLRLREIKNITLPAVAPPKQPSLKAQKPIKVIPDSLIYHHVHRDYLDPYVVRDFYRAVHKDDHNLGGSEGVDPI